MEDKSGQKSPLLLVRSVLCSRVCALSFSVKNCLLLRATIKWMEAAGIKSTHKSTDDDNNNSKSNGGESTERAETLQRTHTHVCGLRKRPAARHQLRTQGAKAVNHKNIRTDSVCALLFSLWEEEAGMHASPFTTWRQ